MDTLIFYYTFTRFTKMETTNPMIEAIMANIKAFCTPAVKASETANGLVGSAAVAR